MRLGSHVILPVVIFGMLKERFIDYLRFEKRFSPNTILSYENDLAQFARYLLIQYPGLEMPDAGHQEIRSWVVSLMNSGTTARSVNRKLSTLKSFFHFCIRSGVCGVNPMLKVKSPKVNRRLPVFIERDKMLSLLRNTPFGEGFEGSRDKLMLLLLYVTGMRRAELIGIRLSAIDREKGTIKVLGKRNKERIIPVGDYIYPLLDIYLKEREETAGGNNNDLLFVSKSGAMMNARHVYSIVHNYLSMVSSQSKLSPHVLRHTFATHMLNDGADLNAIKEILGHTSLAATQVYTHNTIEKLKKIHNQAHPRA